MADVDVVSDILAAAVAAFPSSDFIQSLSHQYLVRGWLTKKQLQGLYQKASKLDHIPPGKLATLEALLARMPTRTRSEKPALAPIVEKDEQTYALIEAILKNYPQHKRVLYLKSRMDNNEVLSSAEVAEAERFYKLLLKR